MVLFCGLHYHFCWVCYDISAVRLHTCGIALTPFIVSTPCGHPRLRGVALCTRTQLTVLSELLYYLVDGNLTLKSACEPRLLIARSRTIILDDYTRLKMATMLGSYGIS